MSDGNRNSITVTWLVFSLFVILVAVWLAWSELRKAEPQATQVYESSAYASRAQTRIDRICVGLAGLDLLHCEYEVEQPERENYRAQKDLRAQWYMAIWAGFMTLFTFGTLIVTGLGVFFVRQTLIQANKTNEAALDAAKAANNANEIMRQEQRPWMILEREIGCDFEIADTALELTWRGKILNWGKSPAYAVSRSSKIVCSRFGEVLMDCDAFVNESIAKSKGAAGSVAVFPQERSEFAKINIKQGHDGSDGIFFFFHSIYYRLENSEGSEIGFDVRFYEIDINNGTDPCIIGSHRLIELRQMRQTT